MLIINDRAGEFRVDLLTESVRGSLSPTNPEATYRARSVRDSYQLPKFSGDPITFMDQVRQLGVASA